MSAQAVAQSPQGGTQNETPPTTLAALRARARRVRKPLLIVPTPDDAAAATALAADWGRLISSSHDHQLAILALCEVGFSTDTPAVPFDPDAHVAVLEMPIGSAPRAVPLVSPANTLAASIQNAIAPNTEAVQALVEESQPPMSHRWDVSSHRQANWPRLRVGDVDRSAALIWSNMQSSEDKEYRTWALRVLADAAARRLLDNDPVGAQWGDTPPGDPCPSCGMSIIPDSSRLFLDEYTR